MNDLNVSTLVMMLDTNIRMNPRKLDEMFEVLEPIDYNANNEGVVKISADELKHGVGVSMSMKKISSGTGFLFTSGDAHFDRVCLAPVRHSCFVFRMIRFV